LMMQFETFSHQILTVYGTSVHHFTAQLLDSASYRSCFVAF
jgi:hypothetical protein